MKITGTTSLIAVLAISGVPFLSGFFSKDAILAHVFTSNLVADSSIWLYLVLLLTAVLTAFYMFRWYYRVFAGDERFSATARAHLHESPQVMTVPLMILAFLSIFVGYLGLPEFAFPNLIAPWLESPTAATFSHPALWLEWLLVVISILAAALGLYLGYLRYHRKAEFMGAVQPRVEGLLGGLRAASFSALGFDALYRTLFTRPGEQLARGFDEVDNEVISTEVGDSSRSVSDLGRSVAQLQSGFVRAYALLMLAGLAVLVLVAVFTGGLA